MYRRDGLQDKTFRNNCTADLMFVKHFDCAVDVECLHGVDMTNTELDGRHSRKRTGSREVEFLQVSLLEARDPRSILCCYVASITIYGIYVLLLPHR